MVIVNTKTKWLVGILGFILFIVLFLLILPFMIDFNKFKPQIQNIVAEKLNAKVNYSSARLTIFTGIGIELKDISLENTDEVFMGTELFKVKNIKFKTEFWPLLKGKFIGNIEINNPEINLMRSTGRNNITSLIKKQALKGNNSNKNDEHKTQEENLIDSKTAPNSGNSFADKILIKSFEVKNATFYVYNVSGPREQEIAKIKNMNLIISNIGVGKDTKIDFSTDLDIKDNDYSVKGLVSLNFIINTELEGMEWKNSIFNSKLSFDNLDINYKNAFVKKKSIPFHMNFSGMASPKNVIVDNFKLDLQSLDAKAKVNIFGLDKLNSDIQFSLISQNLSELGEILPQHKDMLINATLDLKSKIAGSLLQPETLDIFLDLKSKLTDSDIHLTFDAKSVKPLLGSLKIQSQNLYLSKIIKPFMSKSSNTPKNEENKITSNSKKEENNESEKNTTSSPGNINNDEFTLTDKEKKLLAGSDFYTEMNIGKLVYDNIIINNFILNSKIKNYNATLNRLSMNLFSGSLLTTANADLGVYPVPYYGNLNLNGVKLEEIFKAIKPESQKSPIEGKADIKMNYSARGLTRPALSKTLNSKGTFLFNDGTINTKNLVSLAGEQFNKFVKNTSLVGLKIDSDSLKKLSLSDDKSTKKSLKNQRGDFEIKDGKFLLRNTVSSEEGILKLHADIGIDESLSGTAIYIASNKVRDNLTSQSKYAKYFLNEKGEFILDLTLDGTITNPEVGIQTSELQKKLVKNASKELTNKLKEEIKKNPEAQKIQEDAKKLLEKNGIDLQKLGF
jgi:AsmA protein